METNQIDMNQNSLNPSLEKERKEAGKMQLSQEDMLREILEVSRKTKKYMQWQLYITIILIVLPLLAMAVLIPMAMNSLSSLGSVYMGGLQ